MNRNALIFSMPSTDDMFFLLKELKKIGDYFVASPHKESWDSDFKEVIEYCNSYDEDYDPPYFLRENWPSSPIFVKTKNLFSLNNDEFDVVVNFNEAFLWLISFHYNWSGKFFAFSDNFDNGLVREKIFNLSMNLLCEGVNGFLPYTDNYAIELLDDMEFVGGTIDFFLYVCLGGDDSYNPVLFCKDKNIIDFIKNHKIFNKQCRYYDREEVLKDPILNPKIRRSGTADS